MGSSSSSAVTAAPSSSASSLSLLQAVSLGDLPACEQLLLLGASCTLPILCPSALHPYPLLSLVEGGSRVLITLAPCTGLRLSALHMAAATGSLGALEVMGDAALMEREGGEEAAAAAAAAASGLGEEAGWGALDGGDGQGAWPLLISAALALYYSAAQPPSEAAAAAARAHAACARHLLGSAAECSMGRRTGEGVGLEVVRQGLLSLQGCQGALELAEMLLEYAQGL